MNWITPVELIKDLKKAHEALDATKKAKLKNLLGEGRNRILRARGRDVGPAGPGPAPGEFALAYDALYEPEHLLKVALADVEPIVTDSGEIIGAGKYEQLDPGWSMALIKWMELMVGLETRAPFRTLPEPYAILPIPDRVQVALVGDWGTGPYGAEPSPPVRLAVTLKKNPCDYTIHLGDVYYAGTPEQEKENFLNLWPGDFSRSFSLNSNHEMYAGANGYFEMIAAFNQQYSYFALENSNWIIAGLDTAYYSDPDHLFLLGSLGSGQNDAQVKFLSFLSGKAQRENKNMILLSHHNGLSDTGAATNALWDEIASALGPTPPARVLWYYGHTHAAAVYKKRPPIEPRLIGHGAVPWGLASEMESPAALPYVEWFEKRPNDVNPQIFVMNGFARLSFDGPRLKEEILDQNGQVGWSAG